MRLAIRLVRGFGRFGPAAIVAALVCTPVAQAREKGDETLRLSQRSAVPGEVITVSSTGLSKKAKVKIGGKQAEVVSKKRGKLGVRVPDLEPGSAAVVARSAGKRLRGRLKVKQGFSGAVKPVLEPLLAVSADIGPGGGTVSVTGSDGTRYDLTIPARALAATTSITLTPVASLAGLPGGNDAHAVEFAPDGLAFAVPATLRITPATPLTDTVGLAYTGSGEDFTLAPATQVDGSLVVEVRHFTGGGGTSVSEQDFERLVAAIAAQPISLEAAGHFFRDYRAVPASWCDASHPTCATLKTDITRFLNALTPNDCLAGVGSFIDLMRNAVNALFSVEADAMEGGVPLPAITQCRQTLVTAMFDLTKEPARDDPLGFSSPCSAVRLANADYDGDGQISNIECLLLVAAEADVQLFSEVANQARGFIEEGLRTVFDEGTEKCDGTNFLDGKELLNKGSAIAAVSVLAAEFANAIDACTEKIRVAPTQVTLAPGAQASFTATTNYLSPDIRWTANGGTIPSAGNTVQYTAPATPGTYTITATDFLIPGISATATVTVSAVGSVVLSTRSDYAATLDTGVTTEETFPGQPLRGQRQAAFGSSGNTISYTTNADDAGGQLAASATINASAASSNSSNNGATSDFEFTFTVTGAPVQLSCTGSTSDDGSENIANNSGAAVIVDGTTFSGDSTINLTTQLAPGDHSFEAYAFAEAQGAGKQFSASTSVSCTTS